jgi:peptidoglycan/LPS O-acetylase OafA/YrhL
MTTATLTTAPDTTTKTGHPVRRATLVSGAVAAVAVSAVAATASAAGVPFAIDGEAIPVAGFAQMTLLGAVLGGVLAWAFNRYSSQPRRRFVQVAVTLTALSCVPSVMLPPDTASKAILVATHVIAAAIIVPMIARQTHR